MSLYKHDTFAGSAGSALTAHTSDDGVTWSANGAFGSSSILLVGNGFVRGNASPHSFINHNYTIPSYPYILYCTLRCKSKTGAAGMFFNASTSAFDFFYLLADGNTVQLLNSPSGTGVSVSYSMTVGQDYTLKAVVSANNNVSIYIRSSTDIDWVFLLTRTAVTITGPRTAGVYCNNAVTDTTGIHVGNFRIADGNGDGEVSPRVFDGTNIIPEIIWDGGNPAYTANGYYDHLTHARVIFRTNHTNLTVGVYTTLGSNTLGNVVVRVTPDSTGVTTNYPLQPGTTGVVNMGQAIGSGDKTVEIVGGYQGSGLGVWLKTVAWSGGSYATEQYPTVSSQLTVILGDSITAGAYATYPPIGTWSTLHRLARGRTVMDSSGGRRLSDYVNGASALSSYGPARLIIMLGYNDWAGGASAATFGTNLATLLDAFHTLRPSVPVFVISPTISTTEGANGAGSTLDNYRTQVGTVCSARSSYATHIAGKTLITTGDLSDALVHPSNTGHTNLWNAISALLPSMDTTAPVVSSAAVATNGLSLVLDFTEADSVPLLPASGVTGFSVTENGSSKAIASASRTGNTQITLTFSTPILQGSTVLRSYSPGNVTDNAGNALAAFSNQAVTNNSTYTIPAAPTGLAAALGTIQVNLSWNAVSGATSYKVYRDGVLLTTVGTTSTTATENINESHSYTVSALDAYNEGAQSGAVIKSTSTGGGSVFQSPLIRAVN